MPQLIEAIDVCAIPNATWYGSPTKLFEYGAMGKAVIGPMDTPVDEVVTHNVNGVLFKKGDVKALTDGLYQLVVDRSMRERLGAELQGKLREQITWSKNIDNIMALYKCYC
jgi:glycosyltransferase involved in cell wall biosynthesis